MAQGVSEQSDPTPLPIDTYNYSETLDMWKSNHRIASFKWYAVEIVTVGNRARLAIIPI